MQERLGLQPLFPGSAKGIQWALNRGEASCTSDAKRNKIPHVRGLPNTESKGHSSPGFLTKER